MMNMKTWWEKVKQLFDKKKYDYSKYQENFQKKVKSESSKLQKSQSKSICKLLLCILYSRIKIFFQNTVFRPELPLLFVLFIYFIFIGICDLQPHISDVLNMTLPFKHQLHWFLLNSGWRDPISNIYDLSHFKPYSAVIAGMVKDAEKSLPHLLNELDILACSFQYTHFFVLESNSKDNTRKIIHDWSLKPIDCNKVALKLTQRKQKIYNAMIDTPFQNYLYDYSSLNFTETTHSNNFNNLFEVNSDNTENLENENNQNIELIDKSTLLKDSSATSSLLLDLTNKNNAPKFHARLIEKEDRLRKHRKYYHNHDSSQHDPLFADSNDFDDTSNFEPIQIRKKTINDNHNSNHNNQNINPDPNSNQNENDNDNDNYSTINVVRLNLDARIEKTAFQPIHEFPEILELMKRHKTGDSYQIREERYVIYRNFILDHVRSWYEEFNAKTGQKVDYLFWLDMDLRGFDLQGIAQEFPIAFRSGYDVVCANGIKYSGWYYDSYATVYEDGTWAHGVARWKISNEIRTEESGIYDVKSCFGGLAAYHLEFLLQSKCRYEHFGWAYAKVPEFAAFADEHMLHKSCEHLPINYCLRQNGAKLGVVTSGHTLYGTSDSHG